MAAKKSLACVLALSMALTGCANSGANYRPLVDSQGVDMARYEGDLRDCQQYATQVAGAAENAAIGAAVGAIFGAVLAAAAGSRYDRHATARVGAVTGAAAGAAEGETDQRNIIRNCMSGRGYRVLR